MKRAWVLAITLACVACANLGTAPRDQFNAARDGWFECAMNRAKFVALETRETTDDVVSVALADCSGREAEVWMALPALDLRGYGPGMVRQAKETLREHLAALTVTVRSQQGAGLRPEAGAPEAFDQSVRRWTTCVLTSARDRALRVPDGAARIAEDVLFVCRQDGTEARQAIGRLGLGEKAADLAKKTRSDLLEAAILVVERVRARRQ